MSSSLDRFTVLERLGAGGMAEVFKCRQAGLGGFEKLVVLKRILPHLVQEEAFVSMFLDEARIAANLSHPNIVQTYEITADPRGVPYIVMEYVRGASLAELVKEARRREQVDLRHLARLVEGAARGLHHAHHATDSNGKPLHIIHRDISPHNVLVSLEGVAKLADFGVARAEGRITHTQSGVLKGKIRFTAPELLVDPDGPSDPRTDVFSLGVTLYAVTTGQLPFNGSTDLKVMESIRAGTYVPPSQLVTEYPAGLENVVRWLLEQERAKRCPSALAAADALASWLATTHGSSESALAPWVRSIVEPLLATPPPPPPPDALSKRRSGLVDTKVLEAPGTSAPSVIEPLEEIEIVLSNPEMSVGTRRSSWRFGAFALGFVGLVGAGGLSLGYQQFVDHQRAVEQRQAFLAEARRELSLGHFQRTEELSRRAAEVPEKTAEDEIALATLEADVRHARSIAAARAAMAAGDFAAAESLIETAISLEPTDERTQALTAELQALRSARATPPDAGAEGLVVAQEPPPMNAAVDGGGRVSRRTKLPAQPPAGMTEHVPEPAHVDVPPAASEASASEPEGPPAAVMPSEAEPVEAPPVAKQRPNAVVSRRPHHGGTKLHVETSVRAQVFLDGLPVGFTPLELSNVGASTHLVMVWAEGFESATERVAVSADENVTVRFPMARVGQ